MRSRAIPNVLPFKVGQRHGFFRDLSEKGIRRPKTGVLEVKNSLIVDGSENHIVSKQQRRNIQLGNTFRARPGQPRSLKYTCSRRIRSGRCNRH